MARYRIVCTEQQPFGMPNSHAHVVAVGTGSNNGWDTKWTLDEVLTAMGRGDTFHTVSPSTGKVAEVHPFKCTLCNRTFIKSDADAVRDNNLDNLPNCRW